MRPETWFGFLATNSVVLKPAYPAPPPLPAPLSKHAPLSNTTYNRQQTTGKTRQQAKAKGKPEPEPEPHACVYSLWAFCQIRATSLFPLASAPWRGRQLRELTGADARSRKSKYEMRDTR
jgi:hypothetical protein